MRRILTTLVITASALGLVACSQVKDAAKQVVGQVECTAASKLAERLPDGNDLDRKTITKGASLAKQIDAALTKIPGDKVPSNITDPLHTAAIDLEEAAKGYDADPTAAKAKAGEAMDAVRTAVAGLKQELGC